MSDWDLADGIQLDTAALQSVSLRLLFVHSTTVREDSTRVLLPGFGTEATQHTNSSGPDAILSRAPVLRSEFLENRLGLEAKLHNHSWSSVCGLNCKWPSLRCSRI